MEKKLCFHLHHLSSFTAPQCTVNVNLLYATSTQNVLQSVTVRLIVLAEGYSLLKATVANINHFKYSSTFYFTFIYFERWRISSG